MPKNETQHPKEESRIAFASRALGLAENLMLRQNPSEVTTQRAVEVVDASFVFYDRFDEVIREAALPLEIEARERLPTKPIQPGVMPS